MFLYIQNVYRKQYSILTGGFVSRAISFNRFLPVMQLKCKGTKVSPRTCPECLEGEQKYSYTISLIGWGVGGQS